MTKKPNFVDSNIFMYAAGKPHPLKEPCIRILRDIEKTILPAATSAEVLQEILYRYSEIGLAEKGIQLCREILNYPLRVLPVTEDGIRLAVDLFDQYRGEGISSRDAIHVATMRENELEVIVSADKHFDQIASLKRLDPAAYPPKKETVEVARRRGSLRKG